MRWLILSTTALLVLALHGVRSSEDWRKLALDKENEYRALHGVEPRALDKHLNNGAQVWADRLAKECEFYHYKWQKHGERDVHQWNATTDTERQVGENLAGLGSDDPAKDAVKAVGLWYGEIERYPFPKACGEVDCSKEALGGAVGHFTQMVWKDSKFAGYGFAHNPKCKYATIIVARYYPSGNYKGEYKENVFPLLKKS